MELVNRVKAGLRGGQAQALLMAGVAAWQGHYQEAAKLFVQAGPWIRWVGLVLGSICGGCGVGQVLLSSGDYELCVEVA